jgi:hypothetical protein
MMEACAWQSDMMLSVCAIYAQKELPLKRFGLVGGRTRLLNSLAIVSIPPLIYISPLWTGYTVTISVGEIEV